MDDVTALLEAELALIRGIDGRLAKPTGPTIPAACAKLRAVFDDHPKQRALYHASRAKLRATRKTRRAGATAGGVRELLARMLETPGFRATYATTTRIEARARAWRNDTRSGFVDVLMLEGTPIDNPGGVDMFELGGVPIRVREQDLALEASNGSQIELFGADNLRAIQKKRGGAKHVFWIDEAQDFLFLADFYAGVVDAALRDYDGECWLSGTPGRDCDGLFYEVTRGDGEQLDGWEVHEIAVVDNPFFGRVALDGGRWTVADNLGHVTGPYASQAAADRAAVQIRWDRTAGEALRRNGWAQDHPDFQREWLARWVKTDMRHVYAVNEVHHALTYAPLRTSHAWTSVASQIIGGVHPEVYTALASGWYDHERSVADLPRSHRRRQWLFGIGVDFATDPDSFALAVEGFTPDLPDVFEMWSWKATGLVPDDWRVIVEILFCQLAGLCAVLVGDPAGMKGELQAWRERLGLPIADADKQGKDAWIEAYNGDIRRGHMHYREGSPLLDEHRHLIWLPTLPGQKRKAHKHRKLANGRIPGNDCADASLYLHRHLTAFHFRRPADPGTVLQRDEQAAEAAAEQHAQRRKAERDDDDGWDQVRW